MSKQKARRGKSRSSARGVRPFWSGTLTFGLVNVPVHLYPGQRSLGAALRMLAPDGVPLSRRYHCPQHDVDVHPEHLVRGYPIGDEEYVIVRDEDLEAAAPKKSREIDLREFVPLEEIPIFSFERSYYLTPAGDSNKGYRLLAAAMQKTGLAGIGAYVMRGKEYLVAVLSERGILRAATLRYADEIRSPQDVGLPEPVPADADETDAFAAAIEELSQPDLSSLDLADRYSAAVIKLANRKLKAGEDVVRLDTAPPSVEEADAEESEADRVDLLDAIRRSLAKSKAEARDRSGPSGDGARSPGNGAAASGAALAKLSKDELYERAKKQDLPGRSAMTKGELIRALRGQKA